MPIEGFNYKQFANDLAAQASELVPQDFEQFQREYIVKTLVNFSTLAGEAISNDQAAGFNADQAILLTQIIAEWSFHKSVDLVKSGIPPEYWDGVMQKIAFTIFEIGKNTIKQGLPQDEILNLIEHHVKQAYEDALSELQQKGVIDENLKEKAASLNNLDEMMEQIEKDHEAEVASQQAEAQGQPQQSVHGQQQQPIQATTGEKKVLKLASLALLLKTMSQDKVHSILNKFDPQDAQLVIQYMQMNDLERKVDPNVAVQCLKEIKTTLPAVDDSSPHAIVRKIQRALQKCTPEKVEVLVSKERQNVKRFVFGAYQGEYFDLPPKVANVVAQHIQNSV